MPEPRKHPLYICSCGCNREVSRWTVRHHLAARLKSPPPPKRRRTTHPQVGQKPLTTGLGKQKRPRSENNSSTSHSRADAGSSSSNNPQFHAPSFEFNPSLPLLDPPGDALTEASGPTVDDILLNLHARTHRTTDQSDDEDAEDALEGDAAAAADSVDHETDDFWDGGGVATEGDVDPREGIVSDWDLLAEEFIVEAEELGKFEHSLLHTS